MEFDGQIIFLILFVVISGIKWLVEQVKGKKQEPHETSESLEEIYDDFREEIRRRQTQLQGQEEHFPEEATPPPLPTATGYQQEYIPEPAPQTFEVRKPQLSAQERAALANLQKRNQPKTKRQQSHGSLRDLLASPQSAQQAILLQEILGKPKSMRS